MSILSLPTWFDVLECAPMLVSETRGFQGPFGGPTEVQDMLGDRWHMRLVVPDGNFQWGGRTGALFNRLRGGANWLRLHDFARPVPSGTARGLITLSTSAAQGAAALTLANVRGANHVLNGSFEVDTDSNGVADRWTRFSAGSVGSLLQARDTSTFVILGNYSQWVNASSLGPTSGDQHGVYCEAVDAISLEGQTVTASARVLGTPAALCSLQVAWANAAGATISALNSTPLVLNGLSQVVQVTGVAPPGVERAFVYLYQHSGPGGSVGMYADAVRLEVGSAIGALGAYATLLAGDKLGHNGEQLFEVAEDATATDAGVITVTLSNRLRKAIASGQTIVWDKPALPFQLVDNSGVPTAYTRGRARGQQVEFVEAWLA